MGPVAHSLSQVPEEDSNAIATYIMSLQQPAPETTPAAASADKSQLSAGAVLFAGACAGCHGAAAPMMTAGGRPSLALSTAVNSDKPDNLIQIILQGVPWKEAHHATFMPPFAASLTDAQIASIAAYVRADIAQRPTWQQVDQRVSAIRKENSQ
jgi:mono/diheme cytochrome c family protein